MRTDEEGYLLSAFLNSTPVRQLCAALAEPASGGFSRFFSWLIALLPWPFDDCDGLVCDQLIISSRALHGPRDHLTPRRRRVHLERIDRLVEGCLADASPASRSAL